MTKIRKGYLLVLAVKFPKKGVEIDFTKHQAEINKAGNEYNKGHSGREIKIIKIEPRTITITLVQFYTGSTYLDEYIITNPGKSYAKFSQWLYRNEDFKRFSAQKDKLFETVSKQELSSENEYYEYPEGYPKEAVKPLEDESNENLIEIEAETHSSNIEAIDMSDEAIIDTLRYVVTTQNLGNSEAKKRAINTFKSLLMPFV